MKIRYYIFLVIIILLLLFSLSIHIYHRIYREDKSIKYHDNIIKNRELDKLFKFINDPSNIISENNLIKEINELNIEFDTYEVKKNNRKVIEFVLNKYNRKMFVYFTNQNMDKISTDLINYTGNSIENCYFLRPLEEQLFLAREYLKLDQNTKRKKLNELTGYSDSGIALGNYSKAVFLIDLKHIKEGDDIKVFGMTIRIDMIFIVFRKFEYKSVVNADEDIFFFATN